ncbi:MAG TPA: hypothetical protein VLE99_04945 [Candidatus Saccharimonadales bacterium]|nr:hypothetical protein [Candidatus Saccharimonadales bacterium]
MNKPAITLEQRLISAGVGQGTNAAFVRRTMQAVRRAASTQTFEQTLRSEKRARGRSLIGWFRHLPRATAIALLVLLGLVVSGTAYAAYTLWLSPSAQVSSVVRQYGRSQALIDVKNCYTKDQKVTVEITNGSTGTAAGAAEALAAQCEIQAIQNWAIQSFHSQPSYVAFAFTITKVHGNNLTIRDYDTHALRDIVLGKDVAVAFQGNIVPASALKQGDTLALLMKANGKDVAAVVKLSYPASAYLSKSTQNSYHERAACYGNTDASCINLPNLDVLRTGEGGANPTVSPNPTLQSYEIQGKLVKFSATEFTLQATSGKQYVVHTAGDVIGVFNAGNPYGPITIEPNDVIMVMYTQSAGDSPQDIQSTQYHEIQLMMQGFDKSKAADSLDNTTKYHY